LSGKTMRDQGRQQHAGHVEAKQQSIGVGVVVVRDRDVLFGLRRGALGEGSWAFPGGHLDAGESAEACGLRELREETGVEAVDPRVVAESQDEFPEGLRYRTLFVRVDWTSGEPVVREPEKCRQWGWFAWDDPPQPLFLPVASLLASGFRLSAKTAAPGVVEAIHVAAAAAEPVREVEAARAMAGVGLEGDRYALGRGHYSPDRRVSRDLTLIEAEVIEDLARNHGIQLAPGETRRNVTTRGIRLNDLLGHRFWVGEVLCEGTRLCEPCQYLTELTGKPLLHALVHRGGLRADIVRGGWIRRGDRVQLVADEVSYASGADGDRGAEGA
jgi:MOSC domain-containing protein YiiM/ADP-ribose pyrophosphatase YjhB (NUDIX family)